MSLGNNIVGLVKTNCSGYYNISPFNPPSNYPEYTGSELSSENHIYKVVRDLFVALKMDESNLGNKNWNPFVDLIKPGMTVFLKANTVRHENFSKQDVFSVIVHASIIRPILDYICIALKGEGKIIIGESQPLDGNFEKVMAISKISELLEWYKTKSSIPIECMDLRMNKSTRTWLYGRWGRQKIEKDPRGYQFIDLQDLSYFKEVDPSKLRMGAASYKEMYKYHSEGHHKYLFPRSFLDSDVVVNVPKLKTHRRTGITLAIKNFMGLPALKDSLPHFTIGSPEEGGDQYIHSDYRKRIDSKAHDVIQSSRFMPVKLFFAILKKLNWSSRLIIPFKDNIYEAMWPGNDTVWRTLLDINRAALYADKQGVLKKDVQRKYFCIIDGIIGGEKAGPVSPDPVDSRVLIGGHNPIAIDCAAATLIGFDIQKIRLLTEGLKDALHELPLFWGDEESIVIKNKDSSYSLPSFGNEFNLHFEPHPNWKGHIERERN